MFKKITAVLFLLVFTVILSACDIESIINKFTKNVYIINYSASEGGTIDGETTQSIKYGKDAISVTAVPDELYEFLRWSDNVTTATRTDKNIIQNRDIFALFEKSGILIDPSRTNYCEQTFMDLVPNQIITFSYYKIKPNCFSSCYIRFSFELF